MATYVNLADLQGGTFGTTNNDEERHRNDIPLSTNWNVDNCSHTPDNAFFIVNFLRITTVDTLVLRLYEKDNRTFTFHQFESSTDGVLWTEILTPGSTGKGAFKVTFDSPRLVSQIRIRGKSTASPTLHVVRFQAFNLSGIDLLLPKPVVPAVVPPSVPAASVVPSVPAPVPSVPVTDWVLSVEGNDLVFRYGNIKPVDKRVAFHPGVAKDFGTLKHYNNEEFKYIYTSGKWIIREETGVLCIRDTSYPTKDCRYAFMPGSGNGYDYGVGPNVGVGTQVLYTGYRWSIRIENGVLVFRDILTPGDHRYAFFQSYIDM